MKCITLEMLLRSCSDSSSDDGIRIDTELEPIGGPGAPVKPAIYAGGVFQLDRRWASPDDEKPTQVVVIDNVPSQANRLEAALRQRRETSGIPELILDLSSAGNLPAHLPRQLSSLQFPHRNADAYLRDATIEGKDFIKTDLGKEIFGATAQTCGPLLAWFPQSLLYGFWQSHLGKKKHNTKHARAWVSEIVGWKPATDSENATRTFGLKGDPLNLNTDEAILSNPNDRFEWHIGTEAKKKASKDAKKDKLSETGHGQVPVSGNDATLAPISFARITQRATLSFAQLRHVSLGRDTSSEQDNAARALLVALGLHAHVLAFGRSFALRSGAELRPASSNMLWLSPDGDASIELASDTQTLLAEAKEHARKCGGIPLGGWDKSSLILGPKANLLKAIQATWPSMDN